MQPPSRLQTHPSSHLPHAPHSTPGPTCFMCTVYSRLRRVQYKSAVPPAPPPLTTTEVTPAGRATLHDHDSADCFLNKTCVMLTSVSLIYGVEQQVP